MVYPLLGIAVLWLALTSSAGLVILIYGSPIVLSVALAYHLLRERLGLPEIRFNVGKSIWSLFYLGLASLIFSLLGHLVPGVLMVCLGFIAFGLLALAVISPLKVVEK